MKKISSHFKFIHIATGDQTGVLYSRSETMEITIRISNITQISHFVEAEFDEAIYELKFALK